MDDILLASLGLGTLGVVAVLATSVLNIRSVRRGLGPSLRARRVQVATLGLATIAFALLGIAAMSLAGLGVAAVFALPLVGIGLFLVRKAWTYR